MEEVKIIGLTDDCLTIALAGEIDFAKADAFYNVVMQGFQQTPANVCFDCAGLEFIDSTTLGTFVKILKAIKTEGYAMQLINVQANIKRLFVICALDKIITIE